jgi:hypothetical protein
MSFILISECVYHIILKKSKYFTNIFIYYVYILG